LYCCDINHFSNNALCEIVILLKVLTLAWLWPIIKAETCYTLYNKYFAITVSIDVLLIPWSILQITTCYLAHRSLTQVWFLIYWISSIKYLCHFTVFNHILRGFSQSLHTNSIIAKESSSRPNLSDPSHSLFTNHSVARCCTAGTSNKRH